MERRPVAPGVGDSNRRDLLLAPARFLKAFLFSRHWRWCFKVLRSRLPPGFPAAGEACLSFNSMFINLARGPAMNTRTANCQTRRNSLLQSACLLALVCMPGVALAQEATETVVVTGSRVINDVASSPTPLTVVSTEQLLTTTPSDIGDALNKLPVFQNDATRRNAGSASGNGGGEFLNLRNFGQQRTLVLLDGMRVPPSNQAGSVDISTLPQELFSRTEVVTGGGSAVYGSDAVTGVVNFIIDKHFT